MRRHCILTPYPIPPAFTTRKVPNIGDGFILRAVERLFGPVAPHRIVSPRVPLSAEAAAVVDDSDVIILAGANQLNDRYTIWPGLTAETIRSRRHRLVPVGLGLHGEPDKAMAMSAATREILTALHESIVYSSWRCPLTVAYLEDAVPALKGRCLMTGCPVIFDEPLLTQRRFHTGADHIAVTITERGDGWFERERATLQAVRQRYPDARRTLVLHQDYARLSDPTKPGSLDQGLKKIRDVADDLGFALLSPVDADEAIHFYRTVDMHFGSRVHAHLLMLSLNRRSFVTAFDDRTRGLALAFGFPILQPDRVEEALDFDFEIVREHALLAHETMNRFVESLARPAVPPVAESDCVGVACDPRGAA